MMDKNENREMIEAVGMLAKEKGISKEALFTAIEEALRSAYKNNFNKQDGVAPSNANVRVELDRVTGAVRLYASKEEAAAMVKPDLTFQPEMAMEDREKTLHGWHRAVERSRSWIEN